MLPFYYKYTPVTKKLVKNLIRVDKEVGLNQSERISLSLDRAV